MMMMKLTRTAWYAIRNEDLADENDDTLRNRRAIQRFSRFYLFSLLYLNNYLLFSEKEMKKFPEFTINEKSNTKTVSFFLSLSIIERPLVGVSDDILKTKLQLRTILQSRPLDTDVCAAETDLNSQLATERQRTVKISPWKDVVVVWCAEEEINVMVQLLSGGG